MSNDGYKGSADLHSPYGDYNAMVFVIQQILGKAATTALVQIVAVRGGGTAAVGFVDVQPLVMQTTGDGKGVAHGIIYNLPYMRLQGGTNAVIMDPVKGDLGAALICSHDSSVVKSTKAQSLPGSPRRFDWADGLYIGGFLNGAPTNYIEFTGDAITVKSAGTITLDAPTVAILHDVTIGGVTTATGKITAADLTATGNVKLGDVAPLQFVQLADGSPATKVKAK